MPIEITPTHVPADIRPTGAQSVRTEDRKTREPKATESDLESTRQDDRPPRISSRGHVGPGGQKGSHLDVIG